MYKICKCIFCQFFILFIFIFFTFFTFFIFTTIIYVLLSLYYNSQLHLLSFLRFLRFLYNTLCVVTRLYKILNITLIGLTDILLQKMRITQWKKQNSKKEPHTACPVRVHLLNYIYSPIKDNG